MASVTPQQVTAGRDALMAAGQRLAVRITNDNPGVDTVPCFSIHDPDPGDSPNNVPGQPGNAKGGSGSDSWKAFTYAGAATAYGV